MEGLTKNNRQLIVQYKFDKSIYDNLIPEFNPEFTNYRIIDNYLDRENIVTRSIYSDKLPTLIKFGAQTKENKQLALLELLYMDISIINNMSWMFGYCTNLTSVNISNFNINNTAITSAMFDYCSKLSNVIMQNSDYNSVNKIIEELPTRSTDFPGGLDIAGIYDVSQININALNSKYWTITSHTILNNARLGQTKLN